MRSMMQLVDAPVQTDVDGAVGHITLSRPETMNAITVALARGLEAAVRDLAQRARVIVIRGAGGNFCAGGDRAEFSAMRADGTVAALFESFHSACAAIAEVGVPVISAIEGHACAGGFELALASDIVLVRSDARLADIHSNYGMVPAGGSTQRLARLVGLQRALGLILSGEALSGEEAVAWGLAYRAFEPDAFESGIAEFAARLTGKDPDALRTSKRLIRDGLERPLADGIALELQTVVEFLS